MKKHSVVTKLFVATSLLILFIFSLVMFAQGQFFEHFYRSSKINAMEHNSNQLLKELEKEPNAKLPARTIGEFMNQNDTSISILNSNFEIIRLNPYFIKLQTKNKIVKIEIPLDGIQEGEVPQNLRLGDVIAVDGIFMDENDTIMQPVSIRPRGNYPEVGLVRVQGTVSDLLIPENRTYNPLYQDALVKEAVEEWLENVDLYQHQLKQGSVIRVNWSDKWSGVDYVFLLHPFLNSANEKHYLFSMTSMQPVGEAVNTLRKYFIYAAPIIIFLVMLLSLVYSRMISRPLIMLNRAAVRLAKLDFSSPPDVRTNDEFGELSRSLNILSHNLDTTIKQLQHANIMLQEDVEEKKRAEELRKELIASISHELKTPLGIVKGFAEGLQDGVAKEKKERYLALIVNETDRMNDLIMDMLELSKFEVKAVKLSPSSFDLYNLIQRVVDSFSQQMESKKLQFYTNNLNQRGLFVEADLRRIEQVLLNLMSNAIRHAFENSEIKMSIKKGIGTITVIIENNGKSIPEEDLVRIWDHFYRAEKSRDRKTGGTGLGLAIVKHILELHGSDYGAVNTKQGVAFYFTLNEGRK
ncbi:sensor histidine kinase [Paenibacillus ihbetae]|uniref:histidine kinase n=1 Tax=Paenibacillus ihbetae TaxID=1870820 RepID=A0ABX3JV57_9BACL|nr:HAMP domain-containing sensor histidine kinase [Paenibacillus ihbetae]OOC61557.1 two-component sensor histidine kinase [Paenibacillus ihbetae]